MNQCLYPGLAAAVVFSAIGAPSPASAEQIAQSDASGDLEASSDVSSTHFSVSTVLPSLNPQVSNLEAVSNSSEAHVSAPLFSHALSGQQALNISTVSEQPSDPLHTQESNFPNSPIANSVSDAVAEVAPAASSFQARELAPDVSDIVRVIPHALDTSQAATLYVNDIPVLTFVGQELQTLSGKSNEAPSTRSNVDTAAPESRAMDIAERLSQFHEASGNPETILVRWDSELEEYVIDMDGEALVAVDGATILPDTTDNLAEDALQATNRLRRLLGGADPLREIEGQPEPQTSPPVRGNWTINSVATGRASWYGPGFHGRRTASGEVFNQNAMTAAHRTLPFGTLIRVTNLSNNRQVVVRINDRGPFSHGRILDLSAGAAREIGLDRSGVGPIRLEVLSD